MVIIASFGVMTEEEARDWTPRLVFVDEHNKPKESRAEHAGQAQVTNAWG
jgi:aspartate 1-decarboxylase